MTKETLNVSFLLLITLEVFYIIDKINEMCRKPTEMCTSSVLPIGRVHIYTDSIPVKYPCG